MMGESIKSNNPFRSGLAQQLTGTNTTSSVRGALSPLHLPPQPTLLANPFESPTAGQPPAAGISRSNLSHEEEDHPWQGDVHREDEHWGPIVERGPPDSPSPSPSPPPTPPAHGAPRPSTHQPPLLSTPPAPSALSTAMQRYAPPPGPPPGHTRPQPPVLPPRTPTSPIWNSAFTADFRSQARPGTPRSPPPDFSSPPPDPPPRADSLLSEDLPPAYTSSADAAHGETTLEVGPRRPFQRPPTQPQHGRAVHGHNIPAAGLSPSRELAPRPRSSPQNLSEFARDFYAASGASDPASGSSHSRSQSQTSVTGPRYAPPPGAPPPTSSRYVPPSSEPPQAGSSRGGVADDGRPTRDPVPGHPLLNQGKLLVYPQGYDCFKCQNTGYKHYDPSHPCRRCWERYSRPYTGALVYAPAPGSGGRAQPPRSKGVTFQRPLPNFRAPAGSSGSSSQLPQRPAGLSGPPSNIHVRTVSSPFDRPPPGSTVVPPGDPRIGGQLCWNCDGSGKALFYFLDDTCGTCRGLGRVF